MKILPHFFIVPILLTNNTQIPNTNKVVQFDISKILNARPVTTLTNSKLITWTKGIDGNGIGDGYLTLSAALFNGDKGPHALPDNPIFPANGSHPEIKLHYSNKDSTNNQACSITGASEVTFNVPKAKYKFVYLALTSSEGPSSLHISFYYADAIKYTDGPEPKYVIVPDYYNDTTPADTSMSYLAHDLAKWGNKNNMTERDHHNIDLLKIQPDPARKLKSITVIKDKPGYLVFWAAAGIKAL